MRSPRLWAPVLLFLLAVTFTWPYLKAGFWADDYLFANGLAKDELQVSRWSGAWSSSDIPAFNNLWWKDTDFTVSFWRPVPSLIVEGSVRLFGKNPLPLHLLAILVHALVTLAVYRLAWRLTDSRSLAFIAGLFFVTCEDHSLTVAWISTVTDLLCTLFILLSLLGHISYLRKGSLTSLLGSLGALIIALACKETAVVAPLAIILISLLMPRGADQLSLGASRLRDTWRSMIKKPAVWLPAALILLAYLGAYRGFGFGVMNCLMYIDPFVQPVKYLFNAAAQMPIMWLGTLSIWPPFVTAFDPSLVPYVIAPGIAAFVVWIVALWPFRKRAVAVWAMLVYLLALLPQLSTAGGERGLYFAFAAASILLAMTVQTIRPIARRLTLAPARGTRWTRAAGWIAILAIMLPGTMVSLVRPWIILPSQATQTSEMLTALPHIEQHSSRNLVITTTPSMMFVYYCQAIIEFHKGDSPDVWLLSSASGKFSLQRTGESSFVVRTDQPGWISNVMARYVRTKAEVKQGSVYRLPLFTATALEVTNDNTDVMAVSFEFVSSLDDPGLTFLRWNGEAFELLDVASIPIGQTVELADNGSLWETLM